MTPSLLRPRPDPALGAAAIGAEEEALVLEVLRSKNLFRYYGSDPGRPPEMTPRLEREFAEFVGSPFALGVTSGSAALELALLAAGIGPGDEVILPAWSWISCFTAVVRVGARPVLAEIDDSLNLDPDEIVRLATPRTRAVMVIHYQGAAAEIKRIVDLAKDRGLLVLEDCAQSLGVSYQERKVGAWGDFGAFSFQYNKVATAGEGGVLVMRDSRLYERAVRAHDLGLYRPYHAAIVPPGVPMFAGGQYRMSELTAAVALAQLRKVDAMRERCRRLQSRVLARLAEVKGLTLRRIPDPGGDFGYELYLFLPQAELVTPFLSRLEALNVNAGQRTGTSGQYSREYVRTGLAHTAAASPFRDEKDWPAQGYRAADFPRTEALTRRTLALPVGWRYTEEDADHMAAAVADIHRELIG